jgi:hypothetical protein
MRINLTISEVSVLRNALATRHDDLKDLIGQWSGESNMADSEQLEKAREELAIVLGLDARLTELR